MQCLLAPPEHNRYPPVYTLILDLTPWLKRVIPRAELPIIYLVTPTYRRPEQIPDLTRLAQTLLNVPAIHWIVVEDSTTLSPAVGALLNRYGIPHTHLKGICRCKVSRD